MIGYQSLEKWFPTGKEIRGDFMHKDLVSALKCDKLKIVFAGEKENGVVKYYDGCGQSMKKPNADNAALEFECVHIIKLLVCVEEIPDELVYILVSVFPDFEIYKLIESEGKSYLLFT